MALQNRHKGATDCPDKENECLSLNVNIFLPLSDLLELHSPHLINDNISAPYRLKIPPAIHSPGDHFPIIS